MPPLTPEAQQATGHAQANGGSKPAAPVRSFVASSSEHVEPCSDNSVQLTANAQQLPLADVPATGYLRAIPVLV